MLYNSLSFVFVFLPLSAILYYVSPNRIKNLTLLLISLIFYFLLEPYFIYVVLNTILIDYCLAALITTADKRPSIRSALVVTAIFKNIAVIFITVVVLKLTNIAVAAVIANVCITSLYYTLSIYRREVKFDKNVFNFALYCLFFAKIFYGPIVAYGDFKKQITQKNLSLDRISSGFSIFIFGLSRKVFLADTLFSLYQNALAAGETTVVSIWTSAFSLGISMYFYFTAYWDMARGLGLIFSIELPCNYGRPPSPDGVYGFLRHFNITFTDFLKRNINNEQLPAAETAEYRASRNAPSGGELNQNCVTSPLCAREASEFSVTPVKTAGAEIMRIMLISALMGLWAGIKTNYLVCGLFIGAAIIIEKNTGFSKRPAAFLLKIYSACILTISFAILTSDSIPAFIRNLSGMFGLGGIPVTNNAISYLLTNNYIILALCLAVMSGITKSVSEFLETRAPRLHAFITAVTSILLLMILVFYLM